MTNFDLLSGGEDAFMEPVSTGMEVAMNPEHKPSVTTQLAALPGLPMPELWALWDAHFSRRPGTWSREYVISRLAYRIQEVAYGGMDPDIRRRLLRMGESQSRIGQRYKLEAQLLPGTVFVREWGERTHRVTVTPDGRFELDGKFFRSLSAASRHITGTQWSGPKFFGLITDERRSAK